jgi:23S rRNA pseudouridine2605 synthase
MADDASSLNGGMVLARFLARAGLGSRRACEKLIGAGGITVNGTVVTTPATRVIPGTDDVRYRGQSLCLQRAVYYLLHKPAGYTCSSSDPNADRLAIDLIAPPDDVRIYSIGRLDRESEGLLLFTSDGDLAHALTHPSFEVPRTYLVDVTVPVSDASIEKLQTGIVDRNETLRALSVERVEAPEGIWRLRLVLVTGRNREIRRMMARLRYEAVRLRRVAYGPIELGNFNPGYSRGLTDSEVAALKEAVT